MPKEITRREFITKTAAGLAAGVGLPYFVPGRALGAEDKVPASSRLALGFIGVGGMGSGHLGGFLSNPRTEVLAVCDVYEPHRTRAQQRVGEGCAAYNDFRELLARNDIDAVLIATPDHWHTLISSCACEAGKDVYCEKPLTLTIDEGRRLLETVRRTGRVFQVGTQQRSDDNFRFACELVRSGRVGKLKMVRVGIGGAPSCDYEPNTDPPPGLDWDRWLGPAPWVPYTPKRCIYTFRWFYDYSGGMMTDWGAHHNDIAQWGMGTELTGPVHISGRANFPTTGLFDTATFFDITYRYADGSVLNCCNHNRHGINFEGTDGWIHVDRGVLEANPPELLQEELGPSDVHLYRSPGHQEDWLNCIQTRRRPICDVEIGYRSVSVCHLGNIAIRLGRDLRWDPDRICFIGDEEANRWISKPYRAPWHL